MRSRTRCGLPMFAALALWFALGSPDALGAAAASSAAPAALPCADPRLPHAILVGPFPSAARSALPTVTIDGPLRPLVVAVAADTHTRDLGLMCVLHLRAGSGMLFVFRDAERWAFWMKNTLIPLDMIWLDPAGRVTAVARDVPPSTLATPDRAVARRDGFGRYVIEVGAGEADDLGIRSGVQLALPPL
ncbi:MAG: DUF192 domain-containing protein [Vulcanimicrobiaceae bacterium]